MKAMTLRPFSASALACITLLASAPVIAAQDSLDAVLEEPARKALATAPETMLEKADGFVERENKEIATAAREVIRLLEAAKEKAPAAASLVGDWKVRSLQAGEYGVFAYPFFDCQFRKEGPRGIVFQKDRGSQRRIGLVGQGSDGKLLFVGGSYTEGSRHPRGHSALQDKGTAADPKNDSTAIIRQIADGHLLMIFAPTRYGCEIYELKRTSKSK